ncbi:MAG TPA: hypothetical protein VNK81_01100, partial [Thermodesulfobacteriota bacterium]|nr:hypothetical protein [Thermodesulfobacteriota bacterium]
MGLLRPLLLDPIRVKRQALGFTTSDNASTCEPTTTLRDNGALILLAIPLVVYDYPISRHTKLVCECRVRVHSGK